MKSLKSVNLRLPTTISPMVKWIVTIVILGIGVALVVFFYVQEQSRNSELKDDVNKASSTLVKNSLTRQEQENRLIAANLGLVQVTGQFPAATQSMDVEEALLSAAADAGVVVESINCPEPKDEKVGSNSLKLYAVSISVTGGTDECLTLIGRLGYWLPSASIQSVSIGEDGMALSLNIYAMD